MVLHPLEFSECFLDSPWFRQSIREYEDELERTNTQIKQLIKDAKTMLQASRKQGETMQLFSDRLQKFRFEIIGENLTDTERGIAGSLKEFGMMLEEIEGEWTRTIERAELQLIQPLENFRKEHIHSYREAKKAFDKSSERYYKQMEQTLGLSHKKKENQLLEADNELVIQKRNFHESSLNYVFKLQEVQERKKFEFVEHLLMFMQVYFNFFHQTHETAIDCKEYMNDIQMRLVSTRTQYEETRTQTQKLMGKMMADPGNHGNIKQPDKNASPNRVAGQRWARAGYLQLLERNALGTRFASKWSRYFCMYTKENKLFQMMAPASSSSSINTNKSSSSNYSSGIVVDPLIVLSCVRKASDSIDKRFCFDIDVEDSAGKQAVLTLQALSIQDRKKWIAVMDGKEPNYTTTSEYKKPDQFSLNPTSLKFVENVIGEIERRGLDAEGIYRLVGVSSKVDKLLQIVMDPNMHGSLNYQDDSEWELNTLTSALKNFFRNLPEPIMTFDMHEEFIMAAKRENPEERLNSVMSLVAKLNESSKQVLKLLIHHLVKVSGHSDVNKMTVQNIGVCFGPTLMRPKQETVQSIMEIKFNNIIVEILIENYEAIFEQKGVPAKAEKVYHVAKTSMDRLPSQRFKSRPKGFHEKFNINPIAEGNQGPHKTSGASLQPGDQSPRFMRAHAIRGPPGRPLSPRSQMKVVMLDPVHDDGSGSSSDTNTDDFGRMSPLDLDFDLDQHFAPQNQGDSGKSYVNLQPKTQPVDPPAADRVNKEGWRLGPSRRSLRKSNSSLGDRPKTSQSDRKLGTHRLSDGGRHTQSTVQKSGNLNKNNNKAMKENDSLSNDSQTPSVWQRKEKLLDSMRKSREGGPALTQKGSVIRRRKKPLQGDKPEFKSSPESQSVDIEKLRDLFSPQNDPKSIFSPQPQGNESGDHDASFLWPKPGSMKPNTYVVGNEPKEARPRSTVISSRLDVAKSPSEEQSKIPKVPNPLEGDVKPTRKRVFEALFACEAEHASELSFSPGQLIHDVTESEEPGWLVGTLDGQKGLVPANYVREKLWD